MRRQRAEAADRVDHAVADLAPDAAGPEVVAVGRVDRRDRHLRRGERGLQAPVEREALQRVVGLADAVEVAAEPAGREALVGAPTSQKWREVKCDWFGWS